MNTAACFSSGPGEPDFLVHLREFGKTETLCGRKAMPPLQARRKVTCEECLRLKPRMLGGVG